MRSNFTIGVISFPGSNGNHDSLHAVSNDLGVEARSIDHRVSDLSGLDAIILPGGFSYGDALRCGAIARFSPVMPEIRRFCGEGKPVLGICNGFQILCEAKLLPGALLRNKSLRFHCHLAHIRIESNATVWTRDLHPGDILQLPVAHGDGAYFAEDSVVERLESKGQVIARYCGPDGQTTVATNPNGSVANIAAVSNEIGNVVGLMPHPERATDPLLGGIDGLRVLRGVLTRALT